MNTCSENLLRDTLSKYGGVLLAGKHEPDSGGCCILEAHSVCIGIPWTDDPVENRTFDIRPIKAARIASEAAEAAGISAREAIFIKTCQLWIQAATGG